MNSEVTRGLHYTFSDPERHAALVKAGIGELLKSMTDDLNNNRLFAFVTRLRQPIEMYHTALYIIFIADQAAVPHVVSGEAPNSFSELWKAVNREIFDGKVALQEIQLGLKGEEFTALRIFNSSAHASCTAMITSIGLRQDPETRALIPQHLAYLRKLCAYLGYIENMFKEGNSKAEVLIAIKHLHNAASGFD